MGNTKLVLVEAHVYLFGMFLFTISTTACKYRIGGNTIRGRPRPVKHHTRNFVQAKIAASCGVAMAEAHKCDEVPAEKVANNIRASKS